MLPMKRLPQQRQPLCQRRQTLTAASQDANVVGVALSHRLDALQALIDTHRRLGLFLGGAGDQVVEVVDHCDVFHHGVEQL